MEIMKFVADTERSGVRIDRYLADVCPDFSRSYLQKLLKEQMVSVNGKAVRANYKTQTGDEIMLQVPDMQTPDIQRSLSIKFPTAPENSTPPVMTSGR